MIKVAKGGSVQAAKLLLDKTVSNARDTEDTQKDNSGVRVVVENVTIGRNVDNDNAEDAENIEEER